MDGIVWSRPSTRVRNDPVLAPREPRAVYVRWASPLLATSMPVTPVR
jgi:hypothetical protein